MHIYSPYAQTLSGYLANTDHCLPRYCNICNNLQYFKSALFEGEDLPSGRCSDLIEDDILHSGYKHGLPPVLHKDDIIKLSHSLKYLQNTYILTIHCPMHFHIMSGKTFHSSIYRTTIIALFKTNIQHIAKLS